MRDGEWKRSSWLEKWPLALLYREADKLLDALPVLLLGGAAAVVLTWLTHGRLGFPHLLVHSRQTQPGGGGRRHRQTQSEEWTPGRRRRAPGAFPEVTHRVTMSALAVCTAMLRGSWPCSSASVCDAPLFRKRHTWLWEPREGIEFRRQKGKIAPLSMDT